MGFFRLLLASLVLISHLGISFAGLNPGVTAVIIFYLLAGQVVSKLWSRRPIAAAGAAALWFYRDRLLRILPLYGFSLILAVVVWAIGASSPFLSRAPDTSDWLANLLIIPLNFYMYTGQDAFTLLPPAWSLGVELQFYLLVPLLLCRPKLAAAMALLSFLIFTLAQVGWANTDIFGYRLLAGVGFVFLAGTLMDRQSSMAQGALIALASSSAIYAIWLLGWGEHIPYNTEVALGLAIGVPLLKLLQQLRLQGRLDRLQRLAGELSYGLFLLHFPAMWLLQLLGLGGPETAWLVWLISAAAAWLGHRLVERPLWRRYRQKLPLAN